MGQEGSLQSKKGLNMELLSFTLGLCHLNYIPSLILASISFVKLGFVNQYLIYKLFFIFKGHLEQASVNIFVKRQIVNTPGFVDLMVSVVTIQVCPAVQVKVCGCVPK